VRDILQEKMLGPVGQFGTGLLPVMMIGRTTPKQGVPDAVETVYVKSKFGGQSILQFKSYDQKRESFQGTEQDGIWLDEEPPMDIYTECLLRLMTTQGILLGTFTPLRGLSETVLSFLPGGSFPEKQGREHGSKFVIGCGWNDVPHLTDRDKEDLLKSIPLFQRDARSKGLPQLGAGAIYPVPESEIVVDDFPIPDHWRRVYGFDVGWNRTAVLWGALNPDTDTLYLYSEHYRAQAEPPVHAEAIKSRGEWIPGVIDPASRGRSQKDGDRLLEDYKALGLKIDTALNAREAGIYAVWSRLSAGKIKVFRSLQNFLAEYRVYRRDEKGNVVKENDHLMDCMRYMTVSGLDVAKVKPVASGSGKRHTAGASGGWMGA
jgi:phage terminase large subunit-like protein